MADWFTQNAPDQQPKGDWFATNAPSDADRERMKHEQPTPIAPRPYMPGLDVPPVTGNPAFINPRTGKKYYGDDTGKGPAAILDAPLLGTQQVVRGVEQMSRPTMREKAGGLSTVVRGVGQALTPLAMASGVTAPLATAATLGAGMGAQKATERGLNAMGVPEEYSALAGDVAGVAAGARMARPGTIESIKAAPMSAIDRLTAVDPKRAMIQAVKPRSNSLGFTSALDRAMPEMKASEADMGKPITNLSDAMDALKIAKKRVRAQYDQAAGPARQIGSTVDLTPVADSMVASIPEKIKLEDPRAAASIMDTADQYRRQFPIEDAEEFLKTTNAQLDAYYNKYPTAQRTSSAANPETASLDAQGKALRDAIYGTLDSEGQGAAPRELNRRYGSLLQMEDELQRRLNVAARLAPESLSEQIGKWTAAGQAIKGAGRMALGDIGGAADIAGALAKRKAAMWLKQQNTSDSLIRRAFEKYDVQPMPANAPTAPTPAGLLGSGPIITPPPADTSGPIRGAGPTILERESLPASRQLGKGPLVTPPPQDPSGIKVTDAAPVVDPKTGEVLYYSGESKTPDVPYLTSPEDAAPLIHQAPAQASLLQPEALRSPEEASAPSPPLNQMSHATDLISPEAKSMRGSTATVYTPNETSAQVQYRLANMPDLKTSFDDGYPQELQPRNTDRKGSRERIDEIKATLNPAKLGESVNAGDGSPISLPSGEVLTGNHRVQALRELYTEGHPNAGKYRDWLTTNAQRFGLNPGDVASLDQPVLLREMAQPKNIGDVVPFAEEANMSTVARMSDAEMAQMLARRIQGHVMESFDPYEDGTPNPEFVRALLADLPAQERAAFQDKSGRLSQSGLRTIRNAIFAKAYPDTSAIERLAESLDSNTRNVSSGMLAAAPKFATLQDAITQGERHPLGIAEEASKAAEVLNDLKERGDTVDNWLRQEHVFGRDPVLDKIVNLFTEYRRSPKQIANVLKVYAEAVDRLGSPKQSGLFGPTEIPNRLEVLEAAHEIVRQRILAESKAGKSGEPAAEDSPGDSSQAGSATAGQVKQKPAPRNPSQQPPGIGPLTSPEDQ